MTKEEFYNYLADGKEIYLESDMLTFYMCKHNIYIFKETKNGHGITLRTTR